MAADLAGGHVQGRKKSRGTVTHIVVGPSAAAAFRFEWQARLRAIQCLNLAFLVNAKHNRVLRRIEIYTNHIEQLGYKLRIARKLESFLPMRLQSVLAARCGPR